MERASLGDTRCGVVAWWALLIPVSVVPITSPCGSALEASEGGPPRGPHPPEDQEQSQGPHLVWENPGLMVSCPPWVHHTSPEVGAPSVGTPSLPQPPARYWGGVVPVPLVLEDCPDRVILEAPQNTSRVFRPLRLIGFEPSSKENISHNRKGLSPRPPVAARASLMTFSDTRQCGLAPRG